MIEAPCEILDVPGYEIWNSERSGNYKQGGGITILYRKKLMFTGINLSEKNPLFSNIPLDPILSILADSINSIPFRPKIATTILTYGRIRYAFS